MNEYRDLLLDLSTEETLTAEDYQDLAAALYREDRDLLWEATGPDNPEMENNTERLTKFLTAVNCSDFAMWFRDALVAYVKETIEADWRDMQSQVHYDGSELEDIAYDEMRQRELDRRTG